VSLEVTILGCGSSAGVPRVAQGWGVCDPGNPRNRRRRCSILVERQGSDGRTTVLVDTSPDMRAQLLDADVTRLDAILLTHPHADHIAGIDDVRPIVNHLGRLIDIHMDAATSAVVRHSYTYIFETLPGSSYPPLLRERRLRHSEPCVIDGPGGPIEAAPFRLDHGDIDALGFRFGALAYTPDVKTIPAESFAMLENLDVWIIDSLRDSQHPTHFSLADALAMIEKMRPRRAVLTNLSNELDYQTLRDRLPKHVVPAYDGLALSL
jgi:phosphoribosyl 1,2-cyclic phosphate phosphodiesterase